MEVYYSFAFYCIGIIGFISCIIILCRGCAGLLFEVQTFTNSKREIEVSPSVIRVFSRWFVGLFGIYLIYMVDKYYIPIILDTPKILSGTSLGIQGEVLSNHRGAIAFIWIAAAIFLFIFTGKRLLNALAKRVNKRKNQTEIYLWGIEYSIFLFLQAFVTSMCLIVLVGSFAGVYTEAIEKIWNIAVVAEYVLILINGAYTHQKLFIFKNGLVTYHKYRKEGFGEKEDLEIIINDSNKVLIKFRNENQFVLECTEKSKKELLNEGEMLGISKRKESSEETHPEKKETTDEKSLLVESVRKTGQKLEIRNLEENSKLQIAKGRFMVYETNMQELYLWNGTEKRHIKSAKWNAECVNGELVFKKKITVVHAISVPMMIAYLIIAAFFTLMGIFTLIDNDMVLAEKLLMMGIALIIDTLGIYLCYVTNKIFNIEPIQYLYEYLAYIQKWNI